MSFNFHTNWWNEYYFGILQTLKLKLRKVKYLSQGCRASKCWKQEPSQVFSDFGAQRGDVVLSLSIGCLPWLRRDRVTACGPQIRPHWKLPCLLDGLTIEIWPRRACAMISWDRRWGTIVCVLTGDHGVPCLRQPHLLHQLISLVTVKAHPPSASSLAHPLLLVPFSSSGFFLCVFSTFPSARRTALSYTSHRLWDSVGLSPSPLSVSAQDFPHESLW